MAKKVLFGTGYTQSRFAGILHETFVAHNGTLVPQGNVTVYGEGYIATNATTQEIGLILDTESEYFAHLPEVHANRLIDAVEGDGWCDTPSEG